MSTRLVTRVRRFIVAAACAGGTVPVFVAQIAGEPGGGTATGAALYDNNESIFAGADLVHWYHSIRVYSRPSGCGSGGAGCSVAFPNSFRAAPTGY